MALWLLGSCSKCVLQQYICLSDWLANTSTVYDSSPFFAILALLGMHDEQVVVAERRHGGSLVLLNCNYNNN